MGLDEFVRKLSSYDSQAAHDLESYAADNPDLCVEIVKSLLLSQSWGDDPSLCSFAVQQITKAGAAGEFADWVANSWPSLPWLARRKILYCVGDDQTVTISTELASRLFHHPATSVAERHLILAGLAVTAKQRNCVGLV